jgi:hypothetical protein
MKLTPYEQVEPAASVPAAVLELVRFGHVLVLETLNSVLIEGSVPVVGIGNVATLVPVLNTLIVLGLSELVVPIVVEANVNVDAALLIIRTRLSLESVTNRLSGPSRTIPVGPLKLAKSEGPPSPQVEVPAAQAVAEPPIVVIVFAVAPTARMALFPASAM